MHNYLNIAENAFKGEIIPYADILFVKATPLHSQLVTIDKTYTLFMSIDALHKKLPRRQFKRIHLSYIVSTERVMAYNFELGFLSIRKNQQDREGMSIPVDLNYDFNWCRKNSVPGKQRRFRSLLNDLLFDNNN
jgi:hypothetical protein